MISSRVHPALCAKLFLALALLLRIVWSLQAPQWDPKLRVSERWGDAESYHRLAQSLLQGKGWSVEGQPTAFRPPLYPLFLAAIYLAAGSSPLAVRCAQAVLGAVAVFLICRLGRKSCGKEKGAWIGALACGMAAFHPLLIYAGGWLYGETLAAALVTGSLLLSLDRRAWSQAAAGVLAGAAVLTRPPIFLLLPGLAAQSFFLHPGAAKGRAARAALVLLSSLCLICPWAVRNRVQLDRWIPLTTSSGANLWGGNNPKSDGGFAFLPAHPDQTSPYSIQGMSEVESDAFLRSAARSYVLENPLQAVLKTPRKLLRLFSPVEFGTSGRLPVSLSWLLWLGQGVFLALSFCGIALSAREWPRWLGAYALLLSVLVSAVLFFGSPRFHVPALPVLCLFAARGLFFAGEKTLAVYSNRA